MLKVCVFSDSHGYKENMINVVKDENPNLVLYLGDGEADFENLKSQYPNVEMKNVRGNCDAYSAAPLVVFERIEGKKFFLTHGHTFNVKNPTLTELKDVALWYPYEANIVLFGHTHIAYNEKEFGIYFLNPGSIGFSKPSYGIIEINDKGDIFTKIKYVENPQEKLEASQVLI